MSASISHASDRSFDLGHHYQSTLAPGNMRLTLLIVGYAPLNITTLNASIHIRILRYCVLRMMRARQTTHPVRPDHCQTPHTPSVTDLLTPCVLFIPSRTLPSSNTHLPLLRNRVRRINIRDPTIPGPPLRRRRSHLLRHSLVIARRRLIVRRRFSRARSAACVLARS
jgi:hypothetical protein